MTQKKATAPTGTEKGKFQEAERRYREMWAEVKPYVKRRKLKSYSTRGEWKAPGCVLYPE
jgi:hypothetical protein